MRKILCSFQQDTVAKGKIPELEAVLRRGYATHFGPEQTLWVIWCEVPRGQAYTEGRLADGAWIMVEVADGLDQAAREQAMLAMAAEIARVTGIKVERLMVTLCDRSLFKEYLAANSGRMHLFPRIGFLLKTLAGLWYSRRRDGYASVGANY